MHDSWEEIAGADAEGLGETGDVLDTYVPLPSLDASDEITMQAALEAELFLGPASTSPEPPKPLADVRFDVTRPHG